MYACLQLRTEIPQSVLTPWREMESRAKIPRSSWRPDRGGSIVGLIDADVASYCQNGQLSRAPREIRTPDLLLRRQSKHRGPTKNQVLVVASARCCEALSAPIAHILHTPPATTHLSRQGSGAALEIADPREKACRPKTEPLHRVPVSLSFGSPYTLYGAK